VTLKQREEELMEVQSLHDKWVSLLPIWKLAGLHPNRIRNLDLQLEISEGLAKDACKLRDEYVSFN
jgi:hypothetical protein